MCQQEDRPIVAITLGDPAGVGPEICVSCLMDQEVYRCTAPVLIGDEAVLRKAMEIKNCDFRLNRIAEPEEGRFEYGIMDFIQTEHGAGYDFNYGEVSRDASLMARSFIRRAIELGREGRVDVIATAPINKEGFAAAGFSETDHSAMFKKEYPDLKTTSMFHCRELRVFHYTRHISLKQAIEALRTDTLVKALDQIHRMLRSVGIEQPVIAVAALNPHASDNGMFGDEEVRFLIPAVEQARLMGIDAVGPVPADSVFYLQRQGHYDGILTLFHDQGHIACKTYDFERSVSLTFGLPYVRSTVDHGTAYDIAGKGIAGCENLKEAVLVGAEYQGLMKRLKTQD